MGAGCECGVCRAKAAAAEAERRYRLCSEDRDRYRDRVDALGEAKEALREAAQTQAGELIGARRRIHELEEANRQLAHEHR